MNDAAQQQMIRSITEQVIAILRQRSGGSSEATQTPAAIHPPIGVCTGDYSKFTDRPDLRQGKGLGPGVKGQAEEQVVGHAPVASALPLGLAARGVRPHTSPPTGGTQGGNLRSPAAPTASQTPTNTQPPILTGIITATRLQRAIDEHGRYELAPNARLTPLAHDLARATAPAKVNHQPTGHRVNQSTSQTVSRSTNLLWWIAGQCPVFDALLDRHNSAATRSSHRREMASLHEVIADLSAKVRSGQSAGGVLFVPTGALASCYANRCPSLRAVIGSCEQVVQQAIHDMAANVLIIEYPWRTAGQIRTMVDLFLTTSRTRRPVVDRHLRELA